MTYSRTASLAVLRRRAAALARIRAFFAARGVLEVETPFLSSAGVSDLALDSITAHVRSLGAPPQYLHNSPEYAMKRLLASGSGDIYQLCRVFRDDELGRWHQPEFTMLEWYRVGWDELRLMSEVEKLLLDVLTHVGPVVQEPASRASRAAETSVEHPSRDTPEDRPWGSGAHIPVDFVIDPVRTRSREARSTLEPDAAEVIRTPMSSVRVRYDDALERALGLRSQAATERLVARLVERGVDVPRHLPHDGVLDLAFATVVAPSFAPDALTFVHDYPASQAALARLKPVVPPVAARFEVFCRGVELANGFHELGDAAEQRRRFEAELETRRRGGRAAPPLDEELLAALARGFPDCSGVAVGIDRLIALALDLDGIAATMSFAHSPPET